VHFLAHLAAELARVTRAADPGSAAPRSVATVQPLDPALRWDWPSAGPGQISQQQFSFCDTQPASATEATFATGTGSFSAAYRVFLELVDVARFVPAALLLDARAAATPPGHPPSAGVGPPGWVAVANDAGVLEFRPDWEVALLPEQWQIETHDGLSWPTAGSPGFVRGSAQADALDARGRDAVVHAADVARVPVYAGAWYSDALVRLAARGPFLGDRDPRTLVGPGGVLTCRITEFMVAAGLSASMTLDDADARALVVHLAAEPAVRIGPLAAPEARVHTSAIAGGTRVTATADRVPYIVAVAVQPIAGGPTG
jgi:hypothetical protein